MTVDPRDDIRKYEQREVRRGGRPRAVRRREHRNSILPDDRICPVCQCGPILKSRSWVVINGEPQCRSCYFKGLENARSSETNTVTQ